MVQIRRDHHGTWANIGAAALIGGVGLIAASLIATTQVSSHADLWRHDWFRAVVVLGAVLTVVGGWVVLALFLPLWLPPFRKEHDGDDPLTAHIPIPADRAVAFHVGDPGGATVAAPPKPSAPSTTVSFGSRPWVTPDEARGTVIQGRSVWIPDLVKDTTKPALVTHKEFRDCDIYGPAMFCFLSDITMSENWFEAPPADLVIVIEGERLLYGVVGVQYCAFMDCRFHGIGFIGPPMLLERFEAAMTDPPEPPKPPSLRPKDADDL